jgi:hypothetical protein
MYNTKYECRYNTDNIFLETDIVTEDEKDFIRDVLYREDLMHIFYIEEYDSSSDFVFIAELYNLLYKCDELRECMRLAAAKIISENEEMGLCILYSYDFMYLTHKCVCDYLENGEIMQNNLILLKSNL